MARKQTARTGNAKAPYSASTSKPNGKGACSGKPRRKLDPTNAYAYTPGKVTGLRTSEAQLSLSRQEQKEAGPSRPRKQQRRDAGADDHDDEEGDSDEDMQERIRKVAMMIAEEGPGQVESDESDLDSDEAWEEGGSDDERWGDVFRDMERSRKKGKGKAKQAEVVRRPAKPINVNLDESEDDESGLGAQARPGDGMSDVDSDEDDEDGDEDDDEDGEGIEEDEDEDEDDEEGGTQADDDDEEAESDVQLPSDLSDDDDDPAALNDLDAFVDQLAQSDKKRKAGDAPEQTEKKRRVLPVVSAPNLPEDGQGSMRTAQKLDIATLLAATPSLAANTKALLPSKAQPVASSSSNSAILKSGVVAAPLPTVVQERLDREAAYEKTREEGQKWSGVMKRIKEAEHLSFPLQATERGGTKSAGDMLASFKPQNDLESAVTRLLTQANLTDDKLAKEEDDALQAQELSIEEIEERRKALRHQRELMFRAEAKAKRVAKIKSKTFRKMARKRAAKEGLSLEDLERLDPEAADEQREKMERERARERATLKHGASSKFGKNTKGEHGGMFDREDRRAAREEMLQRKEQLQRRIQGKGDRASEDESDDDDDDSDEDDEEAIQANAFDQLASVNNPDEDEAKAAKGKGLMGMKFMQNAQEKRMQRVVEEAARAQEEIRLFGNPDASGDEDGGGTDDEDGDGQQPMMLRVGEGRMVFSGVGSTKVDVEDDAGKAEPPAVPDALPARRENGISNSRGRGAATSKPVEPTPAVEANPWLVDVDSVGPSRKKNAVSTSAESKAVRALKKAATKTAGPDEPTTTTNAGPRANRDDDEEDEEQSLMPVDKAASSRQRELIAAAFAGDNVIDDFVAEKARQVEADAPKVEDTSLPGWGSWAGKGIRKRRTDPRFLVKTAGIEPAARKDAARSNVIISERTERKATKFLVKDLPYPYTSVAQYEAQFAQPVGSEWNSRAVHQKETLPRVVKKKGAIIEPVRRLF